MNKIKYKFLIIWLSMKWILRVHLGDLVWHEGRKHLIVNGTIPTKWRLQNRDLVERIKCKKVLTPKNLIGSFRSGHRFYMDSWYSVWVNEGIKPWMRGLNIWK